MLLTFSICRILRCVLCIVVSCLVCIVVVVLCGCCYLMCTCSYYVCVAVFSLDAGLLDRRQYSEGPATGHLEHRFFSVSLCL